MEEAIGTETPFNLVNSSIFLFSLRVANASLVNLFTDVSELLMINCNALGDFHLQIFTSSRFNKYPLLFADLSSTMSLFVASFSSVSRYFFIKGSNLLYGIFCK